MSKSNKGSAFERLICKQLSLWWSGDRDDLFWRSSQSGGRATQRFKKGKTTYGSYGDVAAVDPKGKWLLKAFTIELKRGYPKAIPGDLLDSNGSKNLWAQWLLQARRSAEQARSKGWMLIAKRNHRVPMVYLDWASVKGLDPSLGVYKKILFTPPTARFHVMCGKKHVRFVALTLENFLAHVTPEQVKSYARS